MREGGEEEVAAEARAQVLETYTFIGSMVGKLVFERLQCEPRFASFFLRKLLGHVNTLDDLASLDVQLHRSLQQLRSFSPQQIDDLGHRSGAVGGLLGERFGYDLAHREADGRICFENRDRNCVQDGARDLTR